jgi:hypothetical protein
MESKLSIVLDKSHGEQHSFYEKLVQFLTNRCQATILDKKPLNLKQLADNSVFMLIAPEKGWDQEDIEAVRLYVERHGGILVLMVYNGLNREHLNQLLEPFGLAVTEDKVDDKNLGREDFGDSALLEGVDSLAFGKVWMFGSTGIAAPDQAEVVLKYKDVIMAARVSLGKGTALLFSCLPVLGNKQLKQDGNARFFNNLLESLETLAAKEPVRPMSQEEAWVAGISAEELAAEQKIAGFIFTGRSEDLFFDAERVIIAKKGSIAKFLGWGFLASVADDIYKGYKATQLSQLPSEKILKANKKNFAIGYDRIKRFEIRKKTFPFGAWTINIETPSDNYSYDWSFGAGRDVRKHTDFLVPLLADKLSIVG